MEEKWEIIKRCWTEESFSYYGVFHQIPAPWTKHHHKHDKAYFDDEVTEQTTKDVMNWDEEGDLYSDLWNPIVSGGTTLKELSVFPQPVQEPYPQVWMPMTSHRSIAWGARQGMNGWLLYQPNSRLAESMDLYMKESEAAGWPDRRREYAGEPFKHGWDAERHRGVITMRFVFNTDVASEKEYERWKLGHENFWGHLGPYGALALLAEEDEDLYPSDFHEGSSLFDRLLEKDLALVGSSEEIIEKLCAIKEETGYEDFGINVTMDVPGVPTEDVLKQMEAFGEDVIPYINEEYPDH
jgi:alkanesulfonate monooxygenase SsuD/methylene tetrahydromethanopterin reductase-like flavin-dependent oxidoreductase (luciferase family)